MSKSDDEVKHVEDGYAGVRKSKKSFALDVTQAKPKPKLVKHKYKCEVGKKSYTFKSKKDMSTGLGLSRRVTNKLLKGEMGSDKLKISMI